MTRYFLGVDTGSSKSHALLCDETGRILGSGEAGPGNWEVIGWAGTEAVLADIIGQALAGAGIHMKRMAAAGFGLAGYDWPEDWRPHAAIFKRLGLAAPFALVNDSFLGLWAGSDIGWGISLAAGTSCNCYGCNAAGDIGRVTGSAGRYGEHAGAGEIVYGALRAVAHAWTQRGPETALGAAFCRAVGASDVPDLLGGIVRERYEVGPEFAPLIFAEAAAGDQIAAALITWAGAGLADLVAGVARQINIIDATFDVVLGGGFFNAGEPLIAPLRTALAATVPGARLRRLTAPPVAGGVMLAMHQVAAATPTARERVVAAANEQLAVEMR